uniref:NADH-ubiquinone oxidoreductase chain 6 n=1 Tax=Hylastes attenuatus TaxID=471226 RepID=A0A343A6J4_9CUCU|nr:NADH dehydrogenase subunit 6 [Hylastes attenuatus]AOY40186.1 NADH dehydrogenase subunit 6 [Hylastes attenuatus]
MFTMNWLLTFLFLFMNHPLTLGFILLSQTIMMSVYSGLLNYNFWFSYILFLVMISGLMIMFIYMTSVASNEKFKMPKTSMLYTSMTIFILLMLMSLFIDKFYSILSTSMMILSNQTIVFMTPSFNPLTKFLNLPHSSMLLFLMNYLLLTLIVIVKITDLNKGALRQK